MQKADKFALGLITAGTALMTGYYAGRTSFKNGANVTKTDIEVFNANTARFVENAKVDSLCKKAYFEGAQMIRDSIKTAAKR